jgi:hypothetical protein
MKNTLKQWIIIIIAIIGFVVLFSCGNGTEPCMHNWQWKEITGTSDQEIETCTLCGTTRGGIRPKSTDCGDCNECEICNLETSCGGCGECEVCDSDIACNECGECEICNPDTGCGDCGECEVCVPDTSCNNCGECEDCSPDTGCGNCGKCEVCVPDTSCNNCGECEDCYSLPEPCEDCNYPAWGIPTCEQAANSERVCPDCGDIDTRIEGFDKLPCDFSDYWQQTKAPTFISAGEEVEICNNNPSHTNRTRLIAPLPITINTEWNTAIAELNGKIGNYTLNISGDIGVTGSPATGSFGTTPSNSNLSVTLKGNGKLYLINRGSIIWVTSRQTLIIDSEYLVLEGLTIGKNGATQNNNAPVIYVSGGGTMELRNGIISGNTSTTNGGGVSMNVGNFTMHGGEISGNTAIGGGGVYFYMLSNFTMNGGKISDNSANNDYGGGVYLGSNNSSFTMNSGEISNNTANSIGGGVYVDGSGTFTMHNGKISCNDATIGYGGGVHVSGTFIMYDGIISKNIANIFGGGVNVFNNGTFIMYDGRIVRNTCNSYGGGVYVSTRGAFTMHNGVIYGNTASDGGGVYVYSLSSSNQGTFRITTGTIYGSDEADVSNRNIATNGATLYVETGSIVQYGVLNGSLWVNNGELNTTNNTIKVVNGELQQ